VTPVNPGGNRSPNEIEEMKMEYYMIVKKQKIYFSFDLSGFRAAQKYLLDHGLKKRKLYVER